ncbi:S41 family peptidase [Tsuneonella amylolytica]|uniref:S41 family peptidase n=1 Tax=Tsuneonella amylolytica TaxID=2338327 RepID=UPI0013C468B4|nr:S41 family peptidase [Tsuneonella amylolytica]
MSASVRPFLVAIAMALSATPAALAVAAPAAPQAAEAAALDPVAVVDRVRSLLRDRYVIAETGAALDAALARAQADGAFAGLSGAALAEAVNRVMGAVTPDGHLGVSYNPAFAADLASRPAGTAAQDEGPTPAMVRSVALNNAGVAKLEVLPGNVRYMDYTGFMWGTPAAEAAIANAMQFLRGGSAVIVDLRRNGGGEPDAVADLASWFLPAGTPLMQFQTRGGPIETSATTAKPFSLADRPVYVLTSKRSFSAAEEFAAHVSAFGFGTLVGETTGGGGFNNDFYPLPGGLVISVSTGQAIQLKTGKGWEGVGIAPAIAVSQDVALERAQAEALTALAATGPDDERPVLERLAEVYHAQAAPIEPARPLPDYAGTFGAVTVALAGDRLVAETPMGPTELVALGGDTFAPKDQPAMRAIFTFESGRPSAIELAGSRGTRRFPRT